MKHFLPFLVLVIITRPFSLAVNVSSNEELTYYLCEAPIQDTLDLYLNSSLRYELHPPIDHFCYINVTRSITISSSEVTNILCNSTLWPQSAAIGFVFHNMSVNIVNITFVHCGNKLHYLNSKTLNYINSTHLVYSSDHGVALLFIECNITTNNLKLIKSFGFAIIGYNIYNSSFSKSEFSTSGFNTTYSKISGSGMLLHFLPSLFHNFINIEHSLFIENVEWLHTHFDPYYYMYPNETQPINNAAGLTVIYMNNSTVHVKLQNTNFTNNSGSIANALLILAHNSSRSYTDIENCNFNLSINTSAKSVLKFYESSVASHNSLTVSNTVFCNHHQLKYTVWISLSSNNPPKFDFENTTFCNNSNNASTVYVTSFNPPAKCSVHFKNVFAFRNSAHTGLFYFNTINNIKISGSSNNFTMNYCPVVYAHDSNLVIDGHATFSNNSGDLGGALKLINTYLHFHNNSNVSFIGNKAHEIGGAIYIYVRPLNVVPWCAITFSGSPIVTFSNNTAVFSANAIYAYPIYYCKLNKTYEVHDSSYIIKYVNMTNESISNDLYNISSDANSIECCGCTSPIEAYPGEMVTVPVKAMDAVGNFVFSAVTVSASSSEWKVPLIDYYQVIEESKNGNCTHINFTIISSCDTSCKGAVSITSVFFSYFHRIPVNLLHCPIGFDNKGGICVCGSAINKFNQHNVKISCFISNQTILGKGILTSMWIGEDNNSLALSQTCPIGYCNLYYGENWIRVLNNNTFVLVSDVSLNDTHPLCMANRMGKLCGQCVNGTSVVFGSKECMKCPDYYWILTSAVYIISGPLVICILFALRLTLTTGTINGIIFYAQAANCGILQFLTIYRPASTFPIVFISLFSLDLGYPMCFYNGMTELWKAYIQLLFPFYLLSILVVLIVLSHFSHRISNVISRSSVQVLVTVVHLSFSKLLFAIIDVFSYAELYSSSNNEKTKVWLWDASINYWSSDHIKLMLFTSVIVSIVLLPYLFLLFTGRLISRYRIGDTLRPFYEAIHGPYKENRKYWFVARLILLMIMCILFAVFRGVGSVCLPLMTSALLMTFIVIQAYIQPFKSTAINILDLIIMLDIVLTYSLGWYIGFVSSLHHSLTVYWLFLITFAVVFVLFLVVLIGHIVWITGKYTYIKECFHRNRNQLNVLSHNRSQIRTLDDASDSFYGSCRYREPVLDT